MLLSHPEDTGIGRDLKYLKLTFYPVQIIILFLILDVRCAGYQRPFHSECTCLFPDNSSVLIARQASCFIRSPADLSSMNRLSLTPLKQSVLIRTLPEAGSCTAQLADSVFIPLRLVDHLHCRFSAILRKLRWFHSSTRIWYLYSEMARACQSNPFPGGYVLFLANIDFIKFQNFYSC